MKRNNLHRWIKRRLCNPMQKLKGLFGEGKLYRFLCLVERHLIVRSPMVGIYRIVHRATDGSVKWAGYVYNASALVDQGENGILDTFFRGQNTPAGYELGLFNDTVAESDTPTTLLGEPSTNGYARQALARNTTDWPTLAQDAGDWKITSKTVTFSASGGSWGPVNVICLITTDATKRLIAYADLTSSRTLADGESLDSTISIKLQ